MIMNKFLDAVKFFFTQYPHNENEILIKMDGNDKYLYL